MAVLSDLCSLKNVSILSIVLPFNVTTISKKTTPRLLMSDLVFLGSKLAASGEQYLGVHARIMLVVVLPDAPLKSID